jgi:hypothetical protein
MMFDASLLPGQNDTPPTQRKVSRTHLASSASRFQRFGKASTIRRLGRWNDTATGVFVTASA